jgi:hypothetical protein
MHKESHEKIVIPPGMTSLRTRYSPSERYFRRELPAHIDEEPTGGMVILPEITSSWTLIQTGKIKIRGENPKFLPLYLITFLTHLCRNCKRCRYRLHYLSYGNTALS